MVKSAGQGDFCDAGLGMGEEITAHFQPLYVMLSALEKLFIILAATINYFTTVVYLFHGTVIPSTNFQTITLDNIGHNLCVKHHSQ